MTDNPDEPFRNFGALKSLAQCFPEVNKIRQFWGYKISKGSSSCGRQAAGSLLNLIFDFVI